MTPHLFNDITDDNQNVIHERIAYRKDSIAMETSNLFPGCVMYLILPCYEGRTFWRIQAYCAHLKCRNYRFVANYNTPNVFEVSFDQPETNHTGTLARQIRRYERDQEIEISKSVMPNKRRIDVLNTINEDTAKSGNNAAASLQVFQKIHQEALQQQDFELNDIADVEAMQTTDINNNFIAKILSKKTFGVYVCSKSQHAVLNKLHKKRAKDGVPIIGRLDASGDIARDVTEQKLLLHALTINVKILHDNKSLPLPLTEQYNIRQTTESISEWLFHFVSSHHGLYDNPPLLLDFIISDFSYANFHAVQLAFNSKTLKQYLQLCYSWIIYLLANGEFPEDFDEIVKICMCYVHIMHTFADMTRRHFGKSSSGAQMPQSRIILEILAAMIKSKEYENLLLLFEQLAILLSNEYQNEDVELAVVRISEITSPIEKDFLEPVNNLHVPIDLDELPENSPNLYSTNSFYLQFQQIVDSIENIFDDNRKVKNPHYNPTFLQKFLQRFVPLIPLWSSILHVETTEPENSPLTLLLAYHNQPVENFFGKYKSHISQLAVRLGKPPIKLGRAITESRAITDSIIKSIECLIPKTRCNSQLPRKPYTKKKKDPIDTIATKDPNLVVTEEAPVETIVTKDPNPVLTEEVPVETIVTKDPNLVVTEATEAVSAESIVITDQYPVSSSQV